jgi:hypothetical protein
MPDQIEQLLMDLATASHELGVIIEKLTVMAVDPATSEAEKRRIKLKLPTMRSDRRDLDALFVAIEDDLQAMPPPGDAALTELGEVTTKLAADVAKAQTADALLGLATSLVAAARQVAG